jgi:Ca2+-binding EF-hand superfamily protein
MSRIFFRASWSSQSTSEKQLQKKEEEIRAMFDILDIGKLGYVAIDIIRNIVKAAGLNTMTPSIQEEIIQLADHEGKVREGTEFIIL